MHDAPSAQQLLYGQIREIDPIHVKMLVHDFESTPALSLSYWSGRTLVRY